jgi:hypothetical protein
MVWFFRKVPNTRRSLLVYWKVNTSYTRLTLINCNWKATADLPAKCECQNEGTVLALMWSMPHGETSNEKTRVRKEKDNRKVSEFMMASCQLLLLGGEFSSPQMQRSGHHTYQSFITQGSYLQATWRPWILLSDILLASGCLCWQEAYLLYIQYVPLIVCLCLCSIGVYNKFMSLLFICKSLLQICNWLHLCLYVFLLFNGYDHVNNFDFMSVIFHAKIRSEDVNYSFNMCEQL